MASRGARWGSGARRLATRQLDTLFWPSLPGEGRRPPSAAGTAGALPRGKAPAAAPLPAVVPVVIPTAAVPAAVVVVVVPVAVGLLGRQEGVRRGPAEPDGEVLVRPARRVEHVDRDLLARFAALEPERPE